LRKISSYTLMLCIGFNTSRNFYLGVIHKLLFKNSFKDYGAFVYLKI